MPSPRGAHKGRHLIDRAAASPSLAELFDASVATAELRGMADPASLYPEELAWSAGFQARRLADFTAGRLCARRALEELGITGFPLAVNADRTPRWPPNIIGSISHTTAFCCAAVARQPDVRSIGVDAEIVGGVTHELDELVFTPREALLLSKLSDRERRIAATLIFSAKEAFYKCQYPVTHEWIDFQEATIAPATSDWASGSFTIETDCRKFRPYVAAELTLTGRFVVDGDLLLTGVILGSSGSTAPA